MRVDTTSYAARAGGGFSFGRFLRTTPAGKQVWETGPLTRILTGDNPGENFFGYDIVLGFDASFVENFYWFDPNPTTRTAPGPSNRGDFMSVVLHELGHGLGMAGNRDYPTGNVLGNVISQFDEQSVYGGNGNPFDPLGTPNPLFFTGDLAATAYGGDVPLTHKAAGHPNYSQNFYHFSSCAGGSPDGLEGSLMNGCVLPNGARLNIGPVEVAMFGDLGYPLVTPLLGDYSDNGAVDAADYTVWRDNLGASVTLPNDDTPGSVTPEDYDVWQANFGGGAASAASIPEPTTLLLAGGTLLVGHLWLRPNAGRRLKSYARHSD